MFMSDKRIILFGGTFDPVHLGHTTVADFAAKKNGAELVIFVPAKRSPLKEFFPRASDEDRLEMLDLATRSFENIKVSHWEINKPAPSYTLDTVHHFQAEFGADTSIYLLVGADGLRDLQHWYRIVDLLDSCNVCIMYRAGIAPPGFEEFESLWGQERIEKLRDNVIETPLIDISSTEIRERLGAGKSVDEMLHPGVAEYIRRGNLYGAVKD
jgi:nicotinate-nucleotide adenylyltransferase